MTTTFDDTSGENGGPATITYPFDLVAGSITFNPNVNYSLEPACGYAAEYSVTLVTELIEGIQDLEAITDATSNPAEVTITTANFMNTGTF